MSQIKRINQVEQSRLEVYKALLKLMKIQPFESISYRNISDESHLSRQTLYRHFDKKEDIFHWYITRVFNEFLKRVNSSPPSNRDNVRSAFKFCDENSELLELLVKHNLQHLFLKRVEEFASIILKKYYISGESSTSLYKEKYFAGGFYLMIITWISNGKRESIPVMEELLLELISTVLY